MITVYLENNERFRNDILVSDLVRKSELSAFIGACILISPDKKDISHRFVQETISLLRFRLKKFKKHHITNSLKVENGGFINFYLKVDDVDENRRWFHDLGAFCCGFIGIKDVNLFKEEELLFSISRLRNQSEFSSETVWVMEEKSTHNNKITKRIEELGVGSYYFYREDNEVFISGTKPDKDYCTRLEVKYR